MKISKIIAGICSVCLVVGSGVLAMSASDSTYADKIDISDITLPTMEPDKFYESFYKFKLKNDGTYEISEFIYDSSIEFRPTSMELFIPSSYKSKPVTSIGNRAFNTNCADVITSITIPSSITSIGDYAFWMCKFTECTIPSSVKHIGIGAFDDTPWLTKKRAENPLVIVNNILVDATTVKGNVTLPNTLTSITPYAFYKNSYLTGVTIPSSIKSIGESTFEYCTSLKSISIPSSVTEIGDTAFAFCESLTGTLTIPGNVKKIGFRSFWCCENLNKIVIQYGLTEIPSLTFGICKNVTDISLPSSITKIGDRAFTENHSLESIIIPESVSEIGQEYFSYNYKLNSATIKNPNCMIYDNANVFRSGAVLYGYKDSTTQKYAEKYERKFVALDSSLPTAPGTTSDCKNDSNTGNNKNDNYKLGDANFDGNVDAIDASLVLTAYANIATGKDSGFTDIQKLAIDVNKDSEINALDASSILGYYAYTATGGKISMKDFMAK